jgi:hypothetical protein
MSVSNVLTEPEGIADVLVTVGTGVGGFTVLAVDIRSALRRARRRGPCVSDICAGGTLMAFGLLLL